MAVRNLPILDVQGTDKVAGSGRWFDLPGRSGLSTHTADISSAVQGKPLDQPADLGTFWTS